MLFVSWLAGTRSEQAGLPARYQSGSGVASNGNSIER